MLSNGDSGLSLKTLKVAIAAIVLHLAVSTHALGVSPLPSGTMRTSDGVIRTVTLNTKSTVLLSSRSKSSSFTMLVNRIHNLKDIIYTLVHQIL